uniref:Ubiquitin carboxyl-terminal hydrolase 36 n=1 Tax=Piliocolobus tephrosceles TaxID=591936 RepID=A0A8C9HGZ9_9PRIM
MVSPCKSAFFESNMGCNDSKIGEGSSTKGVNKLDLKDKQSCNRNNNNLKEKSKNIKRNNSKSNSNSSSSSNNSNSSNDSDNNVNDEHLKNLISDIIINNDISNLNSKTLNSHDLLTCNKNVFNTNNYSCSSIHSSTASSSDNISNDNTNFDLQSQTYNNNNNNINSSQREFIKNSIILNNDNKRENENYVNNTISSIAIASNNTHNNINHIISFEEPAGIHNYSTTCYINVVLQCLSTFSLLAYTLQNYTRVKYQDPNFSSDCSDNINSSFINKNFFKNKIPFNLFGNNNKKNDEKLLVKISNVLYQLSKMYNKGKVLCVQNLLLSLNQKYPYLFDYNGQQDCHEFLLLLFDFVHNMIKVTDDTIDKNNQIDHYLKKEQSIISALFLGLIEEKITCSQCEYVNYIYQPIYNLSVNIFKKNRKNNLNDNLIEYFKKEEVNSTCEKCKCKKMFKYSFVYKQPHILIIHLIRLLEDGSKIEDHIHYDMDNFVIQSILKQTNQNYIEKPKTYNLCGVIVHRGSKSSCGHYVCYTKRRHSNGATAWYKFDDSSVKIVDAKEVELARAYCLFYESQ